MNRDRRGSIRSVFGRLEEFVGSGWIRRGGSILLGRGGDALLRFGVFLVTARVLAPREFSVYALLTAALATAQIVFAFGAPRTAMYLRGRGLRGPLFGWLVVLAAAAALLAGLGLLGLPALRHWLFPDVPVSLVFIGLAPLPFLLLCYSLSATLLAEKREGLYTFFLWARTLGAAFVLAASLPFSNRLLFLLIGRIAVNALAVLGLFLAVRTRPTWRGALAVARDGFRYGLPVAAGDGAVALHRRADVLLLSALGRTPEIGAYAVAYAMAEAFWMVTDSLEAALFADLTGRDHAAAGQEATRALRLYRLGAIAAFPIGLVAGEILAFFFFGRRYPEAAVLFPPALMAAVIWGTGQPCTSFLLSRGLSRRVLAAHLTGLAANVALCLLAIPRFGARGAVLASLTSYAAEVVLLNRFFRLERRRSAAAAAAVST